MKRGLLGAVVVVCVWIVFATSPSNAGMNLDEEFMRGDCNADGGFDLSDAIFLSNYLFAGGAEPPCPQTCDVNADGIVDASDPMFISNALFAGGPQPYGSVTCP